MMRTIVKQLTPFSHFARSYFLLRSVWFCRFTTSKIETNAWEMKLPFFYSSLLQFSMSYNVVSLHIFIFDDRRTSSQFDYMAIGLTMVVSRVLKPDISMSHGRKKYHGFHSYCGCTMPVRLPFNSWWVSENTSSRKVQRCIDRLH